MNVTSSTETVDSFEEQLVDLVAKQPRRMFVPLLLSIVLIAGLASRTAPPHLVAGWLVLATLVMLLRVFIQNPARLAAFAPRRRLQITVALVALSGVTHGLSLVFFPYMSSFEQAVLSMMLVGLAAGSVATAAGYLPIFLAYLVPTLGPLSILWAVSPGLQVAGWVQGLMALLIVLFAIVLHSLARDTFRILRESYDIRLERTALNRELSAALSTAEAANRAKTRFLASASHDLRQPMQTLSLFAAALGMRPLDERSREIVVHINEALIDLTAELDALLDVSKLDAGIVKAQREAFALHSLLARIVGVFKPIADDKGLSLKLECDAGSRVVSDRKLLERVFRNLLENAIKYTQEGGVIISAVPAADGWCRVEVSDTGCGIDELEQARVYEEFYQIENPERDRRRGLGLGLAIVKRLVDLLQLRIAMTSRPGYGTTFVVSVPLSPPAEQLPEAACVAHSAPSGGGLRILLVDDEDSLRRGMRAMLEEFGHSVELASGSDEALAVSRKSAVDMVIADFRLRGDDNGIRTIGLLRMTCPALPALLLTGETSPDRLREAQEAGIPVFHKPMMPQQLLREIARITSAGRENGDAHGERVDRSG